MKRGLSLCGSGTNELEGRLAELMCTNIEVCEMVQILNTGTEATMAAIRLARGTTGRDHVIVMQGGFNGSHNDVACNVLTPLDVIGPRVSPGEYKYVPLGCGVPLAHQQLVHIVNFNDLESVRYVCERYPVAALITEPILQNVGILKPQPGYLQGLRDLADKYGFILIFDEVKTGFRYAIGGYSKIGGVRPDLAVFAKAMANGFPISALVGRRDLMQQIADPNPAKRPFVAGTYNAPSHLGGCRNRDYRAFAGRQGRNISEARTPRAASAGRHRIPTPFPWNYRRGSQAGICILHLFYGS